VAAYFLDTSTIVKRYAREIGTAWVQALTAPAAGHLLAVVRVAQAETVAAVTRKERGQHITPQAALAALADFAVDFANQYTIVEVTPGLVAHAATLARTHALRGYDAVQLAAALQVRVHLPSLTLVSADAELNAAALAEGLLVDDPNSHP
jgi:predicted nucleic acid-binding protein